jgi:hypothetical protein
MKENILEHNTGLVMNHETKNSFTLLKLSQFSIFYFTFSEGKVE